MRTERANAKINLYLNVAGKRENGYHDIVSIMQTVSLCDLVTVDYRTAPQTTIRLEASGNDAMPTDCRNLAWRAAEKFLAATGKRGEVHIIIEKHIPMAAGLAGGSSDAAAVLRALNRLCGSPMTAEELCALGATLGADIPFCTVGGASLVTGIGDGLEEVDSMPACHLVVACMGEGVSTPWAYGALDEAYGNFAHTSVKKDDAEAILSSMQTNGVVASCKDFYNIFEDVVPQKQEYVSKIKQLMTENGAVRAMMSGSGPSVFGVFETAEAADAACTALKSLGAAAFVCHPTAKYSV